MKIENSDYEFKYEEDLTKYLDNKVQEPFDETDILKITLWKVARYPHVEKELLLKLNRIAFVKDLSNEEDRRLTEEVLTELLQRKGVRLPMASTYLRFRNPNVFQIIDRHVWYQVYGYEYIEKRDIKERINDYFEYLEKLRARTEADRIRFFDADRYYYLRDKKSGHKIGVSKKDKNN